MTLQYRRTRSRSLASLAYAASPAISLPANPIQPIRPLPSDAGNPHASPSNPQKTPPTLPAAPPKLPIKNTLHNDHPPAGRSPKDVSQALKNPSLTDDQLVDICAEETPSDTNASPVRDPDNHGTQPPPTQETATSPSTILPTKDPPTPEGRTPPAPERLSPAQLLPIAQYP